MNDKELATRIIDLSGGSENISKAVHCITRLRLYINDQSKFDKDAITKELGLQVIIAGGQNQIIIGPGKVDRVYEHVINLTGLASFEEVDDCDTTEDANIADKGKEFKSKDNLFNKFVALISGIFQPMLGILAGAGMIKGLNALLVVSGLVVSGSNTYNILNTIGDTFFLSLPIFVGFYAMKTFKGTPMLGAVIGAILVSPTITAIGTNEVMYTLFDDTFLSTDVQYDFFNIPILSVGFLGYQYSVIPIIFIAWVASKIEHFCKKFYPDAIGLFFTPFTVILIASLLGLIILGPIFSVLALALSSGFTFLKDLVPVVYGFVLGGLWKVLVLFGLHWALIPFTFLQIADLQAGTIDKLDFLAPTFAGSFGTIGAVLGVMLVERNKQTNAIAAPAFITGIFGIAEPAIYGVILPRKSPFWIACFGSAIGGAYVSLTNNGAFTQGGTGILGFPTYINPATQNFLGQYDLFNAIVAAVIAFAISLGGVLILYRSKVTTKTKVLEGYSSPIDGTSVDINSTSDPLFASESMGPTVAIEPTNGVVKSPVDGEVLTVFPTKHAIGLKANDGNEILIHIGIDTVNLAGKYFTSLVKEGDKVTSGQEIGGFDLDKIKQEGFDPTVFVVVTNNNDIIKKHKTDLHTDDIIFVKE